MRTLLHLGKDQGSAVHRPTFDVPIRCRWDAGVIAADSLNHTNIATAPNRYIKSRASAEIDADLQGFLTMFRLEMLPGDVAGTVGL